MKDILKKIKAIREFIKFIKYDKAELYYDRMCQLTKRELEKIGNESLQKYK